MAQHQINVYDSSPFKPSLSLVYDPLGDAIIILESHSNRVRDIFLPNDVRHVEK